MSTTALPTLDISGTAKVPFHRLVRVELRKSYDTRASFWLLASIVLIAALIEGFVLVVSLVQDEHAALEDFVFLAATANLVLLPVLGIMLVTTEWSQRTAMVTFALEPRRPHVVAAKAIAGLLLALASAVAILAVGILCEVLYGALSGGDFDWTLRMVDVVGVLLIATLLAMLSGFALATLLLNTPGAIVVFFLYRFALPGILAIVAGLVGWFEEFSNWINFQRAQLPLWDLSISGGEEWGQLIVSGLVWLVLPLALGVARILRAEVK